MILARDNPFSTNRVLRLRYRLDETGWQLLLHDLARHHHRAAIVGPHGAGKTTLLEDLADRLRGLGWHLTFVRLSSEARTMPRSASPARLRTLGRRSIVLLDGAEQLPGLAWLRVRWASRHLGGLVITTHKEGRLPTLHRCSTDVSLLQDLTLTLGHPLDPRDAAELHARHHGNLREALRELYDRMADRGSRAGSHV